MQKKNPGVNPGSVSSEPHEKLSCFEIGVRYNLQNSDEFFPYSRRFFVSLRRSDHAISGKIRTRTSKTTQHPALPWHVPGGLADRGFGGVFQRLL